MTVLFYTGTVRWLLALALSAVAGFGAGARIRGRVIDETQAAVAAARVWIGESSTSSDQTGAFQFELDATGEFRINAQKQGFFLLRDRPLTLAEGDNLVTLVLNHQREQFDSVEVSYSPPAVNQEETRASQQLLGTEILGVPYPNTHDLRHALPLLPGVLEDRRGFLHFHGGGPDQTYWTLDGFNITDPVTGRFETRLGIDGVRAIQVDSSRYSAETGKGSAGAVDIRTGMGDDRWRPSATNFVPGFENHKGFTLTDWTPRASFSGPIRRGRAWLFDSLDAQYDKNIVDELPVGQDRNTSWRASNLLRTQVNLAPSNILTASWLVNYWNAPRNGLTFLDPVETTVDRRARQHFFSVKDQIYLGRGALIEIGYAATRGFAREMPQGRETYKVTPEGRQGNFFLDSQRDSGRDQWLAHAFLPAVTARGSHHLRAGVDLNRLIYSQRSDRHSYEIYRSDGTRSRRIEFGGASDVRRKNFEAGGYLQDRWKPLPYLLVEMGLRADWDQIIRRRALSPRVSVALAVPGLENTKIAAGFGLFHDATNLRVLSRHLDQYSVARYYGPDGQSLAAPPSASFFRVNERGLTTPVYRNWSVGAEQLFPWGLHGRFEYLRKRGRGGFTFGYAGQEGLEQIYALRNERRDVYDSFEVTLRKTFRRQYEWLASYTRSRALSNAVMDVNIDDPVLVADNAGRLPWDMPNRFLSWGLVPLTEKNSLAYLLEWRDGFPFNVVDEEGRLDGKPNERRFPTYFSLNLHWERRFALWRWRWAWRGGFNNITDRLNPTAVNNNVGSRNFLQYSGGQRRAFVMRIRWLGRK